MNFDQVQTMAPSLRCGDERCARILILFTEVRVVVGFPAFINAKSMG